MFILVTFVQLGDDLHIDLTQMNFVIPDVDEQAADAVTAQQMGTQLFELYLALHEFCSFKDQLSNRSDDNAILCSH